MLTRLDRLAPEAPNRPDLAGPDHPMRAVTRQIAASPAGWDPDRAAKVRALFDGLAPDWNARFSEERLDCVEDALARGDVPTGTCLEVGSGTGLITPLLTAHFATVVSIDLSHEMLVRAPSTNPRIEADGGRLPLTDDSVDAVALVNAFLFPHEVDRVLRPDGVVLWVSTIGDRTPIYLPAQDVLDALPGEWDGVESEAGWGSWLVARRARL